MSLSFHTLSKALDISKNTLQDSRVRYAYKPGLYKYYGQWTAVDLHKNHWLENQIDELIVVRIFQDIQTKN